MKADNLELILNLQITIEVVVVHANVLEFLYMFLN